ncbi:MAG: glycine zipper 2TM domain-containing protein [Thermodesulfovibrionales bacterium]|nr:glycine zipper 2TM domain-containing protein [Thermodesulfovibrionales bacterium]
MFIGRKVITSILVLVIFVVSACATRYQYEGAVTGGAIGGVAGALLDRRNPWRGGVIGAALGAIAGATIADISTRGSREVYTVGRPVEYRTEDGRGRYRAEPEGEYYRPNEYTKCRKVRERVWEEGRLVKDTVREVCESTRYERGY